MFTAWSHNVPVTASTAISLIHSISPRHVATSRAFFTNFRRSISQTIPAGVEHSDVSDLSASSSEGSGGECDVIVCGGGIAGLATALCFRSDHRLRNCRVALLEAGRPPPPAVAASNEFSARTVALNAGSRSLLQRLGVWQRLSRYGTITHMQVWETQSDAMIRFEGEHSQLPWWSSLDGSFSSGESSSSGADDTARGDGEEPPALGHVVENSALVAAMSEQLHELGGCELVYEVGSVDVKLQSNGAAAKLPDGRCWKGSLIIGADGSNSAVRRAIGSSVVGWGYGQCAIVAVLALSNGESDRTDGSTMDTQYNGNTMAWQRYLPSGPLAILPLSETRSALVWSVDEEEAARLMQLGEEEFVDALNRALWTENSSPPVVRWACAQLQQVLAAVNFRSPSGPRQMPPGIKSIVADSRGSFPLVLQHSSRYVGRRAVLVGDSAHRLHPMAGQGANLALADVEHLVQTLSASVGECGADLGSPSPLLAYESARQRAAVPMMAVTDALYRLYGSTRTPVVLARSLGLQLCDALPPVRRALMHRAAA